MSEPFRHWSNCYGCGPENPDSHGVVREQGADGSVFARVHLSPQQGGAKGVAHGGHLMFLMDELMGGVGNHGDPYRVTTDMVVKFMKPVPLDADVIVEAHVESQDEQGMTVRATVTVEGAESPAAQALGTFRFVDLKRLRAKFPTP